MCIYYLIYNNIFFLGRQLYGKDFKEKNVNIFESYLTSYMTALRLVTLDEWYSLLSEGIKIHQILTPIYMISVIFIGNYIFMNLFIAVIIKGFEELNYDENDYENMLNEEEISLSSSFLQDEKKISLLDFSIKKIQNFAKIAKLRTEPYWSKNFSIPDRKFSSFFRLNRYFVKNIKLLSKILIYEKFMLFVTLLSVIKYIIDSFTGFDFQGNTNLSKFSEIIEMIYFIIFFLEFLSKIVADGILLGKNAYLRDWKNIFDFIPLLAFILSFYFNKNDLIYNVNF